jgi:hypothetical protein
MQAGKCHLCGRVLDFQELQDGRAIVGDCDISYVINKHLRRASHTLRMP